MKFFIVLFLFQFAVLFLVESAIYDYYADFPIFLYKNAISLSSASEELFSEIMSESKFKIVQCLIAISIVIFACLLNLPFIGDEQIWQSGIYILNKYSYLYELRCIFYTLDFLFLFSCGLIMIPYINFSIYNTYHIKFQYKLLNAFILKLGNGERYHINDIRYQERVFRQLKFCIRMQLRISKISDVGCFPIRCQIIPLTTFGISIFVCSYFFINSEISPASNFRMYSILLSWMISLYILCSCVQEVTDETEKLYWNLCQCHWEDWNNENRGILLLMLVKYGNPWTLSKGFVVNNRLIVKIYRLGNALVSYFVYTLR
ncbi:uncharacterized protein [Leptinotarsa decemlineata]|uniref:uncharacterized protein n=1 Tax=Leptinotarsa decemlineata TaxID=7539 RepID=UPI003D30B3CF